MKTITTLDTLIERLQVRGDAPAVIAMGEGDPERWSGAELARQAERLAAGLARDGIGPGARVALVAEASPAWAVACLAGLRAGAEVVPVDVQFGDDALTHVIQDSDPALIFCSSRAGERLRRMELIDPDRLVSLDAGADDNGWEGKRAEEADFPSLGADDPAVLFYTSGTTGRPKGVPLTHANIASQIRFLAESGLIEDGDRALLPLPLHHVYPLVIGLFVPLALGVPVVLPRSLTGPELVRVLREGEVSIVIGVPRLYSALREGILGAGGRGKVSGGLLRVAHFLDTRLRKAGVSAGGWFLGPARRRLAPRLRVLASGGSPLDPELSDALEGFGWKVAVGYGLTETSPLLTLRKPGAGPADSVGEPLPGVEVRIAEGNEEETGGAGEIHVRGPNVFAGYLDLPDKTEEAFTEDGWFRTGDLGHLDEEGNLHIAGRASTLIVTEGGENLQPEGIEDAYAGHPLIREAGVLQKGAGLVAVLVPETKALSGEGDPEDAVAKAVAERSRDLPSYQRLTDFALSRRALARTRLGKLRRHMLPGRYEEAKGGDEAEGTDPLPVEEMSDEDRALLEMPGPARVWDYLTRQFPDARLSPDTHFQLDLGVDSLGWLNLTLGLGRHAGVELGEEALGRVETARDLLREAGEARDGTKGPSPTEALENPEAVLSADQKKWLRPPGVLRSLLGRALHGTARATLRGLFRLRVEGREHVPAEGPFILTPNHTSSLDPFALAAALDHGRLRQTYWAGWTGAVFEGRFRRALSRVSQTVPIDPDRAASSSLAFAAAVLGRGQNLIWFPEGERSADGTLQEFKPGIGLLLRQFQVPVVPVYLHGSHEALPRGRRIPRPRRVTVLFGPAVSGEELAREGEPGDIANAVRKRVARLAERLGGEAPGSGGD